MYCAVLCARAMAVDRCRPRRGSVELGLKTVIFALDIFVCLLACLLYFTSDVLACL